MRWVDQPDWSSSTTETVLSALSNGIFDSDEMRLVWINSGFAVGEMPSGVTPRLVWAAMLRDASDRGHLEQLLAAAQTLKSNLAPALADAFAQVAPISWYSSPDLYTARMLGPGAIHALIDRIALSQNLRDIVVNQFPVCNIRGASGTGKSYSRLLIQHIGAQPTVGSQQIRIGIGDDWPDGVGALEFVPDLADRLGMDSEFIVDTNTHPTTISRSLANKFLSRYERLPPRTRWIFIDGLDRAGVQPDVHLFVSRLALAAASGELERTRLFLTGHPGDFHSDVIDVIREEVIEPIDRTHVEHFFLDVAGHVNVPMTDQEAAALTDQVLAQAPISNLRDLGRAAGRVARERFASS